MDSTQSFNFNVNQGTTIFGDYFEKKISNLGKATGKSNGAITIDVRVLKLVHFVELGDFFERFLTNSSIINN